MKTVTFNGKCESEIEKQIWDWKSTHPNAVFMNPPVEVCMLTSKKEKPAGAEKTVTSDLISVCFEYKNRNQDASH